MDGLCGGGGVEVEEALEVAGSIFFCPDDAGEAGEADGGDGGGVCPHGGEAQEAGAGGFEFCGGGGVYADEGVDGFAAGGVDGGDGFAQLDEDAQPGLRGDGV